MSLASFTWTETDPARPAQWVALRLIAHDWEEKPLPLKYIGDGHWFGEFDLPDDLRTSYQFCPVRDTDSPDWDTILAAGEPDPSPRVERFAVGAWGNDKPSSILEMPGASLQPWSRRRDGVPAGKVKHVDTGREWPDAIDVYTPAGPVEEPTLVVLLDGKAWMKIDVTATFDNLIGEGKVPAFCSAILSYPFGPIRVRALSDPEAYLSYLLDELLPWLAKEFGIAAGPERTVLIGQSLGGLAAIHAGLQVPDRIGMVLGQSSSLWWTDGPLTGEAVIASTDDAPGRTTTRFWLESGVFESTSLVEGNRRLFAAMAAQGYQVNFKEYQGGHDFACWRGGLAEGLIALLANR